MKLKGPEVVLEWKYCGNLQVHPVEVDWFPGIPPISLENWYKTKEVGIKVLHNDGTPFEEGEIIPAICPKCSKMGMPESILDGYEESREEVI